MNDLNCGAFNAKREQVWLPSALRTVYIRNKPWTVKQIDQH